MSLSLKIEKLRVEDLHDSGSYLDAQDPAVKLMLGGEKFVTERIPDAGTNAEFPEEFTGYFADLDTELLCEVINVNARGGLKNIIGYGKIKLSEHISTYDSPKEVTIPLSYEKSKGQLESKGQAHMILTCSKSEVDIVGASAEGIASSFRDAEEWKANARPAVPWMPLPVAVHLDSWRKIIFSLDALAPHAHMIEEKAHFNVEFLVLAVAILTVLCVAVGIFEELICDIVGFAYPLYGSLLALHLTSPYSKKIFSASTSALLDTKQWLTYWVVFCFFGMIEGFGSVLLYWFPFYYLFKLLMLLWCMSNQTLGATSVYENALKPLFVHVTEKLVSFTEGK